tara:strand:- start:7159 stop:7854 length:696 start_codon:yes stop_codon:yes gene_type:complete
MSSLDHLIKKLAGASPSVAEKSEVMPETDGVDKTNPVYVEKLASAVDFIVDSISSEKTASVAEVAEEKVVEEVAEVSEISAKLKQSLQSRLMDKVAAKASTEVSAEDNALIQNVLGRLKGMKAATNVEAASETVEDEINQIYQTDENTEVSNEADGEAAVKAASADLSLADVLNAALGTDEQETDSDQVVDDEVAKTANVQGSVGLSARKEVTNVLKEKLLAKIGGEEAQS